MHKILSKRYEKSNNEFKEISKSLEKDRMRLFCVKHPVRKGTYVHAIVRRNTCEAASLSVLSFSPLSARSFIYHPLCSVKRREKASVLFSRLFTAIFFSPVLPRLMAHFKRRNCSQFISGMQSATQRCARQPQSPNTISSPIKQHHCQSSAPL